MSRFDRFHGYQPALQELSNRLTHSQHDVEDAVQDVWVECLTRPRSGILHVSSYLRVAVRHAALRRVKRERNRQRREEVVARPESQPSFVEELERRSILESLLEEVETLRSPYREVVQLRYLEELATEEVSRRLGRPQATVRIQLKRGLDQLRERLYVAEEFGEFRPTGTFGSWIAFLFTGGSFAASKGPAGAQSGLSLWRMALAGGGVLAVILATALTVDRNEGPSGGEAHTAGLGAIFMPRPAENPPLNPGRLERTFGAAGLGHDADSVQALASSPRYVFEGVVWDRHGRVVPGAEIWLSPARDPEARWVAGHSDAVGSYRVESDTAYVGVWAERNGLAPTRKLVVNLAKDEPGSMDLHFRAVAGKILGRVVDAQGQSVIGAIVRVDARFEVQARLGILGRLEEQSATGRAYTNIEGFFEIQKQRVTRHRLIVTLEGSAPFVTYLESPLGEDHYLDIVLPEAAELSGRVVDLQGQSASGIDVRVQFAQGLEPALARTDQEGVFRVGGLPPGAFLLRCSEPIARGGLSVLNEGELLEGETKELATLVLGEEASIWGFAIDERGRPLSGWNVVLEEERYERSRRRCDRDERETATAEDGSFRFPACLWGRYKLRLFRPGCEAWGAQASLVGITPSGDAVRLVRSIEAEPTAQVLGRVSAELFALEPKLRIRGDAFRELYELDIDPDTHAFGVGPLTPGRYALEVEVPGYGTWDAAVLELEPGDRRDLGSLPFLATGELIVNLGSTRASCNEELSLRLRGPHIDFYTFGDERVHGVDKQLEKGAIGFPYLLPGNYVLTVRSGCHAEEGLHVTVAENATTEIYIPEVDCTILNFAIASPRALYRSEETRVVLRREGYWETVIAPIVRDDKESLMRFTRALPAGVHTIEVSTTSGLVGRLQFDPAEMESRTTHVIGLELE